MVLYSAKVDDVAVPVNSNPDSEIQQKEKPKRKLSEKQLAAREERERAKQQKLAEKEAAKAERLAAKALAPKKPKGVSKKQAKPEQPVSPPPTSSAESVDLSAPTSVPAPAPIPPPTEAPIEQDEPVLEPVPMKRTSKKVRDEDPNEPPAWFKTFIKNAKKEEAKASSVKRPSKQVEQEANEMAHQQWQDPYTRDRINNQANEHMRKMHNLYNQMFYK